LEELRRVVDDHLAMKECPYCLQPLTIENFSVDHARPISRGGGWEASNLCVCCRRCNEGKGQLTGREWMQLRDVLRSWNAEEAERDVLRRLRAGGRIQRG
jgi:5-methylcytosine-specific restriction endonuclease McrA